MGETIFREDDRIIRGDRLGALLADPWLLHVALVAPETLSLDYAESRASRSGRNAVITRVRCGQDLVSPRPIHRWQGEADGSGSKVGAKRSVSRKPPKSDGAKVRDLEEQLAEARRDKAEALDQQTATAEILQVISRSPTNIQPVFDAIAESANRLCDVLYTGVFRFDAGLIRFAAHNSWPELAVFRADYPAPATDANWNARAILERRVMHVRHSDAEPGLPVQVAHRARALGIQSYVAVPMLREGEAIGTITVSRAQVGGFSDTRRSAFSRPSPTRPSLQLRTSGCSTKRRRR